MYSGSIQRIYISSIYCSKCWEAYTSFEGNQCNVWAFHQLGPWLLFYFFCLELWIMEESAGKCLWLLVSVTGGTLHVTRVMWHVTCDTWHVKHVFLKQKVTEKSQKNENNWLKRDYTWRKVSRRWDFIRFKNDVYLKR